MSTVFSLSGLVALPFWVLMILFPRRPFTERLLRAELVIVPAALLYAVLVLPDVVAILGVVQSPELPAITALLGSESGATIAWVHFLAFDLFVGRWIYLDSRAKDLNPWLMAPVLYLTLMLGPIGFLTYTIIAARAGSRRR